MTSTQQVIKRVAWLNSTAYGYDITIKKTFENDKIVWSHYENVSAATMKRFYQISNQWQSVVIIKHVHWSWFRKVRHGR